ncbi:shikimate kinase AroK [Aliiglaciecola sp. NS0011-25]
MGLLRNWNNSNWAAKPQLTKVVIKAKMAEKRNIFLVGPMGAGKSTIGRHLADELHLEFFDSDQEIERRTGADIAWIFDLEGEDGFRLREETVINDLTDKQGIVLATGGGSIVSKNVRNRLSARGIVVYLQTTIDKQVARTQRDKRRPLLQKDDPEMVLRELAESRNPLYEEVADYIVDTDDQSARAVASQIIDKIGL